MAKLESLMVKRVLSDDELTLAPDPGKAFLVKDVKVYEASTSTDLECWIDQKSVFYVPEVEDDYGCLTLGPKLTIGPTILAYLASKGIETSFPIAEGQTFTVKTGANVDVIEVHYEVYDAGDIMPDMPNGTEWTEWTFISWGQLDGDKDANAWYVLNTSINPSPYPGFPFGEAVPSGVEVDVLGVLFRLFERNEYPAGSDAYVRSKYLRFTRGTEVLFDEDLNGFYVLGDGATSGSANVAYCQGVSELNLHRNKSGEEAFLLPEPLTLSAGEDLTVEVYLEGDSGATADEADPRCGLILRYRRV